MAFSFNDQTLSMDELQVACALNLFTGVADETLGSIIGFRRGGPGAPLVPCDGLVNELQRTQHAAFAIVSNDPACWEIRAREEYKGWWEVHSQIVQRYVAVLQILSEANKVCRLKAEGAIVPYLDTEREHTA